MVLITNNSQGCVINTWIDTINCANFNIKLCMNVMLIIFPLDLAAVKVPYMTGRASECNPR